MSEIDALLNLDPLLEAEKMTGASYKDDADTLSLGLLLQMQKGKAVREEMGLRDDTHYGSSFADALRLMDEMGFSIIHEHTFTPKAWGSTEQRTERFVILWREGVLAVINSYGTQVNSFSIYYNWRCDTTDKMYEYTSSGCLNSEAYDRGEYIWIGHHDARVGLKHILSRLEDKGTLLTTWVERPFLWFVDYAQERVDGYDHKKITEQILSTFPEEIIAAIGTRGR